MEIICWAPWISQFQSIGQAQSPALGLSMHLWYSGGEYRWRITTPSHPTLETELKHWAPYNFSLSAALKIMAVSYRHGLLLIVMFSSQHPSREFLIRVSYMEIYNEVSDNVLMIYSCTE